MGSAKRPRRGRLSAPGRASRCGGRGKDVLDVGVGAVRVVVEVVAVLGQERHGEAGCLDLVDLVGDAGQRVGVVLVVREVDDMELPGSGGQRLHRRRAGIAKRGGVGDDQPGERVGVVEGRQVGEVAARGVPADHDLAGHDVEVALHVGDRVEDDLRARVSEWPAGVLRAVRRDCDVVLVGPVVGNGVDVAGALAAAAVQPDEELDRRLVRTVVGAGDIDPVVVLLEHRVSLKGRVGRRQRRRAHRGRRRRCRCRGRRRGRRLGVGVGVVVVVGAVVVVVVLGVGVGVVVGPAGCCDGEPAPATTSVPTRRQLLASERSFSRDA